MSGSLGSLPGDFGEPLLDVATLGGSMELSLLACGCSAWCGAEPEEGMPVAAASHLLMAAGSAHQLLPGLGGEMPGGLSGALTDDIPMFTAVLCGDALIPLALGHLASECGRHAAQLVSEAVRAMGGGGFLSGLCLDLDAAEGRLHHSEEEMPWEMSAGSLSRFAAMGGAMVAGAPEGRLGDAAEIGVLLGRAHLLRSGLSRPSLGGRSRRAEAARLVELAMGIVEGTPGSSLLVSLIYLFDMMPGSAG